MSLRVGLLGGGSWGTTVASLIAKNTDVMLWARDPDTVKEVNDRLGHEWRMAGVLVVGAAQQFHSQVVSQGQQFVVGHCSSPVLNRCRVTAGAGATTRWRGTATAPPRLRVLFRKLHHRPLGAVLPIRPTAAPQAGESRTRE